MATPMVADDLNPERLRQIASQLEHCAAELAKLKDQEAHSATDIRELRQSTEANRQKIEELIKETLIDKFTLEDWAALEVIVQGHKFRETSFRIIKRWAIYTFIVAALAEFLRHQIDLADLVKVLGNFK